jgi:hypothetical protein
MKWYLSAHFSARVADVDVSIVQNRAKEAGRRENGRFLRALEWLQAGADNIISVIS